MSLLADTRAGLLQLTPSPTLRDEARWRRLLAFLIVGLLGLLITWFVFDLVATRSDARERVRFEREASQIAAKLQSQFDLSLEYLRAIPPFFEASDEVTPADFRLFVADALERHEGIHTFEYLPRVPAAEVEQFEARARETLGLEGYKLRSVDPSGKDIPLQSRDDYFPVYFGQPFVPSVTGIDLASHPEQGFYVERARAAKDLVSTTPLSLIEDPPDVLSVIAFAPVGRSVDQSGECEGLAILILRIRAVIESALDRSRLEEFQIALVDPEEQDGPRLVYKNFEGASLADTRFSWPAETQRLRFADQSWELTVSPGMHSEFAEHRPPYWILFSGLALSTLAAYSLSAMVAIGGLKKQVDEALELGQYTLGRKLGEGGMGVVYKAEHRMLARPAAIKLIQLNSSTANQEGSVDQSTRLSRFEKEAKATAMLESPNTISVYDFGKTPDGAFYYVMELLNGTDLSTLVKQTEPLSAARTIHLVRQVCASLAEAHSQGLIHRDIKPANIFVCQYAGVYDFVKVLDFGLVKSEQVEPAADITQAGALIGTPAFIAPEMLMSEKVDGRTDLYSLGCVMYWLLSGKPPFEGQTPTAVMAKHLTKKPTSLRELVGDEISPELDAVVLKCLAKKPSERPQNAMQLDQLLSSCPEAADWTQVEAEACWRSESPLLAGVSSSDESTRTDQRSQDTVQIQRSKA